jgi:hypothetical protein
MCPPGYRPPTEQERRCLADENVFFYQTQGKNRLWDTFALPYCRLIDCRDWSGMYQSSTATADTISFASLRYTDLGVSEIVTHQKDWRPEPLRCIKDTGTQPGTQCATAPDIHIPGSNIWIKACNVGASVVGT